MIIFQTVREEVKASICPILNSSSKSHAIDHGVADVMFGKGLALALLKAMLLIMMLLS